jgi:hypothetical protein
MRAILLLLGLILVCGCSTVSPYRVGRVTTVGYLLSKDKLSEEQVATIKKVYMAFEYAAENAKPEDAQNFDQVVKQTLRQHITDDRIYSAAVELVDLYWKDIQDKLFSDRVSKAELVSRIKEFHRGTKEALQDYQ